MNQELVFATPQHDISFVDASGDGDGSIMVVDKIIDSSSSNAVVVVNDNRGVNSAVLLDVVVDVGEDVLQGMLKDVITNVKARIGEIDMGSISLSTLPMLIRIVMEIVERTVLKGNSQKVFATRVISELIDELPESDEKGFLKATCASGGIEGTIDLVVAASKGELDVNKVASVALKRCAPPLIGYMRAKVTSCMGRFTFGGCKRVKKD